MLPTQRCTNLQPPACVSYQTVTIADISLLLFPLPKILMTICEYGDS